MIMKNQAHIAEYAKQPTMAQLTACISVANAHGIHITYEIAKASNKTRPTALMEATLKMSYTLA